MTKADIIREGAVGELEAQRRLVGALKSLKILFDTSLIGIYILLDGKFQFVNTRFQEISGYNENELLGKYSLDLVHPEDRNMVRENAVKMLKGERSSQYEYRTISKNGANKWIAETVVPIQYLDRRAVLGNFMDITDHKQMEEALRESRNRHLDMVNLLPQIVFELDEKGNLTFANRQGTLAFGYTLEDIKKGLNALQLVVPEDQEKARETIQRVLNGERSEGIEFRILRKDGNTFPAITYLAPIVHEGRAMGLRGIIVDITERKQMEERLRESRGRFIDLVNFLPQTIFELDERGNLTFGNRRATLAFGYTLEDVRKGLNGDQLFIPEDQDRVKANREKILNGEDLGGLEYTALRKDGSTFPAILYYSRITRGDKTVGLRGVLIDITERKRMEEELKQTLNELQRSNAELEQFAYVASHDLQEPLRMVASYTQLLARRYQGKLDADADDFIAYAVGGANRMQKLINDLLAYSRVSTRGKPFELTDCEAIVDEAVSNLQMAIGESDAVITRHHLPTVMADPTQLVQLFQNLIGNAIKFRKGHAPEIHIGAEQSDGMWSFSVRDNGIGIDPQYADRIFLVFQRLHSNADYRGTGIGLAICKKIVERHGGRIWVEPNESEGSTFYFTIPMKGEK